MTNVVLFSPFIDTVRTVFHIGSCRVVAFSYVFYPIGAPLLL